MAPAEYVLRLRSELKQWETAFAVEHGRKPSRDDVKNGKMAAKYKEYKNLRDLPSEPAVAPPRNTRPKQLFETPRKPKSYRQSTVGLEQKHSHDDPFHSPSIRYTSKTHSQGSHPPQLPNIPPESPTSSNYIVGASESPLFEFDTPLKLRKIRFSKDGETVGPTPQKTGKVLGLFESMIEGSPAPKRSPVRRELQETTNIMSEIPEESSNGSFETPQKRRRNQDDDDDASPSECTASGVARSSHRSGPSSICPDGETPRKRRLEQDMFETPSFLRRTIPLIIEPSLMSSPPVPFPQLIQPKLVKGLSSLMAELRKAQDERLEEEMDSVREYERERERELALEAKGSLLSKPSANLGLKVTQNSTSDVNVKDSEKSLSVEKEIVPEAEAEVEAIDEKSSAEKAPVSVWKKRGLKRQTRRVKMRPVKSKPQPTPHSPEAPDGEAATVDKTQLPADNAAESDGAPVRATEEEEKPVGRGRGRKAKKATATATAIAATAVAPAKDGTKPARKGKRAATTGANYCKLKIRTQNGYKGKGGGQRAGGRFGRRR